MKDRNKGGRKEGGREGGRKEGRKEVKDGGWEGRVYPDMGWIYPRELSLLVGRIILLLDGTRPTLLSSISQLHVPKHRLHSPCAIMQSTR